MPTTFSTACPPKNCHFSKAGCGEILKVSIIKMVISNEDAFAYYLFVDPDQKTHKNFCVG